MIDRVPGVGKLKGVLGATFKLVPNTLGRRLFRGQLDRRLVNLDKMCL